MILKSGHEFGVTLDDACMAVDFVRSPENSLARVRFLRNVRLVESVLSGELVVRAPGLGDVNLPFRSDLVFVDQGAELVPQFLMGERAWVSVAGQARVDAEKGMQFAFQFEAHVALPEVEGWGGAAFEKMVRSAAQRTLSRVMGSLPTDITGAWQDYHAARRN